MRNDEWGKAWRTLLRSSFISSLGVSVPDFRYGHAGRRRGGGVTGRGLVGGDGLLAGRQMPGNMPQKIRFLERLPEEDIDPELRGVIAVFFRGAR